MIKSIFVLFFLVSSLFSATTNISKNPKVLIIGAGPSGLTAAMELNSNGIDFEIFEATNHTLGRIKAMRDFADFPIELGQEFIHGNDHIFYRLARQYEKQGLIKMVPDNLETIIWVPSLKKMMTFTELRNSEFKSDLDYLTQFEDSLWDYDGPEMSIREYKELYFKDNQFKEALSIFTSTEKAASDDEIGILGVQEDEESWGHTVGTDDDEYSDYFLTKGAMEDFLKIHFEPILSKVRKNTPIVAVDYTNSTIIIETLNGDKFEGDYVIITVPLGVLKNKMIFFNPPLPQKKLDAIEQIGFSGTLKINIKFKKPLWPLNVSSIVSNGVGKIVLFWLTNAGGKSQNDHVLTAFFAGEETYAYENDYDATKKLVLEQLAKMFNISFDEINEIVIGFFIQNWNKENYTRGAYSFIRKGYAYKNLRRNFAKNVEKKLFFAGEAASDYYSSCVQGGMETATEAVNLIIKQIQQDNIY